MPCTSGACVSLSQVKLLFSYLYLLQEAPSLSPCIVMQRKEMEIDRFNDISLHIMLNQKIKPHFINFSSLVNYFHRKTEIGISEGCCR